MSYVHGSAVPENGWRGRIGLLLVGQLFSLLGSNIVQYAIWWWIVLQTKTGSSMLLATLFGVVPGAVVSILSGSWADRYSRRMLIILPDAIIAGVTVLLAVAFACNWAGLGFIFVVLFVRSVGGGVQMPAVQSFIPDIVPEKKLLRINSIYGVINSANMIIAPALAAVLVNAVPLWAIMLLDVATALIGVGCVSLIRVPHEQTDVVNEKVSRSAENDDSAGININARNGVDAGDRSLASGVRRTFADLKAGLGYVMRHRRIRAVIAASVLTCMFAVAPTNLTLLLVARVYAHDDLNLGFVTLSSATDKLAANELCWSVGMVLGGLVTSALGSLAIRNHMRICAVGVTTVGLAVLAMGVVPTLLMFLFVDACFGVASALFVGPYRTIIQTESDPKMIGRVFGVDTTLSSFGMPLGMLFFAPLSDAIAIQWVFVIGGLLTLPVGMYLFVQSAKREIGETNRA